MFRQLIRIKEQVPVGCSPKAGLSCLSVFWTAAEQEATYFEGMAIHYLFCCLGPVWIYQGFNPSSRIEGDSGSLIFFFDGKDC